MLHAFYFKIQATKKFTKRKSFFFFLKKEILKSELEKKQMMLANIRVWQV